MTGGTGVAGGIGRLAELDARGVALWLDGVGRDRVRDGGLASLVRRRSVSGAVVGQAGFAAALKAGAHRDQLAGLAGTAGATEPTAEDALLELLATDAHEVCEVLLPLFAASRGASGLAVVDVDYGPDPGAEDVERLALRVAASADSPNLLVAVPATAAGLAAARSLLAGGQGVVVGPVTTVAGLRSATEAVLAGLEAASAASRDLGSIAAAVNFALSATDSETDKRLWAIATDRSASFRGRTAVAIARTAFAAHEELLGERRWQDLAAQGARAPFVLWTSTRARDPYYSESLYVDSLIAPGVANAMTEVTLGVVAESAEIRDDSLRGPFLEDAERTLADLRELGIDFDDVARVLEAAATQRARAGWDALRESVRRGLAEAGPAERETAVAQAG